MLTQLELDYQALRRAVIQDPWEDTPRLALADFLDEHPDEEMRARGEFIRLQVELLRNPDVDQSLRQRGADILAKYGMKWKRAVALEVLAGRLNATTRVRKGHPELRAPGAYGQIATYMTINGGVFDRGYVGRVTLPYRVLMRGRDWHHSPPVEIGPCPACNGGAAGAGYECGLCRVTPGKLFRKDGPAARLVLATPLTHIYLSGVEPTSFIINRNTRYRWGIFNGGLHRDLFRHLGTMWSGFRSAVQAHSALAVAAVKMARADARLDLE